MKYAIVLVYFNWKTTPNLLQPPDGPDGGPLHNSSLKCIQCVIPPLLPQIETAVSASTVVPPILPSNLPPARAAAIGNAITAVSTAMAAIANATATAGSAASLKLPMSTAPTESGLFSSQINVCIYNELFSLAALNVITPICSPYILLL